MTQKQLYLPTLCPNTTMRQHRHNFCGCSVSQYHHMAVWLYQFPCRMGVSLASRQPCGYTCFHACLVPAQPQDVGAQLTCHVQRHNVVAQTCLPMRLPSPVCLPAVSQSHFMAAQIRLSTCQVCPSASNGPESNACSRAFCIPALPQGTVYMPVSLHAIVQCCHIVTLASVTPQWHGRHVKNATLWCRT